MDMAELRGQLKQATQEVKIRKERVRQKRKELVDTNVATYARENGHNTIQLRPQDLTCCRTLQGHMGKVYSLDWARGKDRIVSASQDGHLIVWNALTSQKTHAIKLACSWVMTCAFSPSGHAVACGGLDSVCTVYTLSSQQGSALPDSKVLTGHKGYVSCCKYAPDKDNQLFTSSGDRTCALWDTELGQKLLTFGGETSAGHSADVMSLSICSSNSQHFVSGSCDRTARLWDIRTPGRAMQIYQGHDGDVNTVQFFPDGLRFGTGSDDSTCRIFDTRTGHELQEYKHSNPTVRANSIAFSHSGRLLFAAYTNADCYIWDTLTAELVSNIGSVPDSHTQLVSCLGLASDGSALCTGSWDSSLKIWACNNESRTN
ncbi:hypothetical protein L7F22_033477 [Adiantum nelumboides]|nr:hypothetical protein [Adiantum nelumboides]